MRVDLLFRRDGSENSAFFLSLACYLVSIQNSSGWSHRAASLQRERFHETARHYTNSAKASTSTLDTVKTPATPPTSVGGSLASAYVEAAGPSLF